MKVSKRLLWVDVIKIVSLSLIIVSHVTGSHTIFTQLLFGFNVPCMVLLSAYLAKMDNAHAIDYYRKRFVRLVIPTWGYFTLYFVIIRIITIGRMYPYSTKQIFMTYAFMDGIGFTWVFVVFLMTAILIPVFKCVRDKLNQQIALLFYALVISDVILFICPVGGGKRGFINCYVI